jgi:opacity protein-like surface antigen
MIRILVAALSFAAAAPALAQDVSAGEPAAPDGTEAFGFEPYVGILGGVHAFENNAEIVRAPGTGRMQSPLIAGIAGVNIPLGPLFAGVEGNVAKGTADINWEYGVKGRLGLRAGESGLLFVSAGYQWVNGRTSRGYGDNKDWIYGLGAEIGPKTLGLGGITGETGVRLRLEVQSYDFDSIRPMAGLVFHF